MTGTSRKNRADILSRAQQAGHIRQGPRKGQDQHRTDHGFKSFWKRIHTVLEGKNPSHQVKYNGKQQCRRRTHGKAQRSVTSCKRLDKAFTFKKSTGIDHSRHAAYDQRHHRNRQIHHSSLGRNRSHGTVIRHTISAGKQIALCRIVLMLFHRSKINIKSNNENNHGDGKQRIQVIRNRSHKQIQSIRIRRHTSHCRCPGRDRCDHAHRSRRGVNDIRQLCPGNIVLIRHRTHDASYGQTVKIIIHEDQDAQCKGSKQRSFSCLDPLLCPFSISCRTAGSVHQHHDGSQNH